VRTRVLLRAFVMAAVVGTSTVGSHQTSKVVEVVMANPSVVGLVNKGVLTSGVEHAEPVAVVLASQEVA
jgi:hypothetical protein